MAGRTNRRSFLTGTGTAAGLLITQKGNAQSKRKYKAAVIGRTGGGDYGHGYDKIFNGFDNIQVVAVADENREGLQNAKERIGIQKGYLDYHEMLETEKPDLVCIAPRQPDCHKEMALAAIDAGAHIFMEKPITEYPKEADEMLAAADKKNVKISVAHTKRYSNSFLMMRNLIQDGYFGEVLETRFTGKQDSRVGGEDLIVLGSHDMDMMRFFFGDPQWCFANVLQDGKDAAKEDVHQGNEPYTILGDTIRADYQFENNVQCRWLSVKGSDEWNRSWKHEGRRINKWGFTIYGSKRVLSYMEGIGIFVLDFPFVPSDSENLKWKPLESIGSVDKPAHLSHPIRNLLYAIENDVPPHCSGHDARWAVEMVNAVYHSHKAKCRVAFPLKDRRHPLLHW